MAAQRLLTASEIAGFMVRHPIESVRITETHQAILAGVYDWLEELPGMIPPWGTQIDDSSFGAVTVYFGTDGTPYFNAFTGPNADINKPAYVPPPFKCKNGSDPVFGVCAEDFNFLYVIGAGLLAFVGYQMFFAKK
jgi:hypothetical protein